MFSRKNNWLLKGVILLVVWNSCISLIKGQRLANRMCDEYRQTTIKKPSLLPLTFFSNPIEVTPENCTNEVYPNVGGLEARHGEFPHHALLGYNVTGRKKGYDFLCGGSLISEQHVITAAQCFSQAEPTVVRLGEYDTSFADGHEHDVDVAAIRKHPQYVNRLPYHDIALVKLANRIYFTRFIRPACLWDTEFRNISNYIATGFGSNELNNTLSSSMMKVQLKELPKEECTEAFKNHRRFRQGIQDGQLCIGSTFHERDSCQGDVGGPLQTVTSPTTCMFHIVGITSTGTPCGIGQTRATYTKVSFYLDWIEENVWGSNAL